MAIAGIPSLRGVLGMALIALVAGGAAVAQREGVAGRSARDPSAARSSRCIQEELDRLRRQLEQAAPRPNPPGDYPHHRAGSAS